MPPKISVIERRLLSGIKSSEDLIKVQDAGIRTEMFRDYSEVYDVILDFDKKFSGVPTKNILRSKCPDFERLKVKKADLDFNIEEIKKAFVRRTAKNVITDILDIIEDPDQDPNTAIEYALENFMNVSISDRQVVFHFTDEDAKTRRMILKKRAKLFKDGKMIGIKTGIAPLDRDKVGFLPGHMIILAGPPEVGKSWILLNAGGIAYRQGLKVLYVNPEMSRFEFDARFDCIVGQYHGFYFRNSHLMQGKYNKDYEKWVRLASKSNRWLTLDTEDGYDVNIHNIEKAVKEYKPDMLLVDTMPLVLDKGFGSDWSEVTDAAYAFKSIAKRNGLVSMITMASSSDTFDSNEPAGLGDLALARYASYAADMVITVALDTEDEMSRYVRVPKRRGGRTIIDKVKIKFDVDQGIITSSK